MSTIQKLATPLTALIAAGLVAAAADSRPPSGPASIPASRPTSAPASRPAEGRTADWPQWRGANRDGLTAASSNHPAGWPPKKLWAANVGRGCTSPILAGGRVYVMGWAPEGPEDGARDAVAKGVDTVSCFEAATGKPLWKQTYPAPKHGRWALGDRTEYAGPSSTPTFDAETGLLYTLGIDGMLACWNASDGGKPVWTRNLFEQFHVARRPDTGKAARDYGFTASPLVLGDRVLIEVGAQEGTVIAFDKKTGQVAWRSQSTEPAGHTGGPVPMTVEGKPCVATLCLRKLVVMRTDVGQEGRTVAEYDWVTNYGNNIATPAVAGNRVILTSAQNVNRMAMVEVGLSGAKEVWTSPVHSASSTPVIRGERIYVSDTTFECVDLATGALRWKGGKIYCGTMALSSDGKIIGFGQGALTLAEADPADGKYKELARTERFVPEMCYPHLAVADGLVACKDRAGNLAVFSTKP